MTKCVPKRDIHHPISFFDWAIVDVLDSGLDVAYDYDLVREKPIPARISVWRLNWR